MSTLTILVALDGGALVFVLGSILTCLNRIAAALEARNEKDGR